jgi:hypothetical protein
VWQICDLDVYNYLYKIDLKEYQKASKKTLHVSDFIMVLTTITSQVPTESWSQASDSLTSNNDDEMVLRVPTTESLPTWNDKSEPSQVDFPAKDIMHPSRKTDIAMPSQGSSPHAHGGLGTISKEKGIENLEESLGRLEEAGSFAMRERCRKDKEGLEFVAANPIVVKLSSIIPRGAASTSSSPIMPSTMEVEKNESDPIPLVLSGSEDVDGEKCRKRSKPNPVHILNSSEDGCGQSVLPLNTVEQSFEKAAIPGGETMGTGCLPFIPTPHMDIAMMEGGLGDSAVEAALLLLLSTLVSGATPEMGEANLWDNLEALATTILGDNPYDLVETSVKDPQGIAETDFGQVGGSGWATLLQA